MYSKGGKRMIYHFGEYKGRELFEEQNCLKMHHVSLLELNHKESCQAVHAHKDRVEILYLLEGKGYHTIGKTTYETQAGDLLIINAGTAHEERVRGKYPLRYCVCAVTDLQIKGMKKDQIILKNQKPVIKTGEENTFFNHIFQLLINETLSSDPLKNEICSMLAQSLIIKILDYYERNKEECFKNQTSKAELKNEIVLQVQEYLNQNFKEKITLKDAAQRVNINPCYLERIFKKNTGTSFTQYIMDRRLGYAQNLLRDTKKSIAQIAEESGYDNQSYFSQLFKKRFGCTPGAYRKKIKKH